jgi:gamma-glutamylcyclotransferase (GGCT)/AIG2-like uncharacterized protein YtfP
LARRGRELSSVTSPERSRGLEAVRQVEPDDVRRSLPVEADKWVSPSERGKWLHELFTGLYFSNKLIEAKNAIEYRYGTHLATLLEARMNDRHVPIDEQDVLLLDNVDCLLNYIEHVLGLERLGLMSEEERKVIFDYWPNIIGRDDQFAALRRFIVICGYELITEELGLEDVDYLVVYGSLMRGLGPDHQPDFTDRLEYVGDVRVPGALYEVVEGSYRYPGLKLFEEPESRFLHPGRRTSRHEERLKERTEAATVAELYRVLDATVFEEVDAWEHYDATDPENSPYVRRILRMIDPAVDAWIYVGNHADQTHLVPEKSWRAHLAATS